MHGGPPVHCLQWPIDRERVPGIQLAGGRMLRVPVHEEYVRATRVAAFEVLRLTDRACTNKPIAPVAGSGQAARRVTKMGRRGWPFHRTKRTTVRSDIGTGRVAVAANGQPSPVWVEPFGEPVSRRRRASKGLLVPPDMGLLTFLWVAHSGTVDTGGLPDGRQSRSSCSEGPLNGFAYSGGGPSQTGLTDGEPSMDPQKSQ